MKMKYNLSYDPQRVTFYDVYDADTNELLSRGITMDNVMRRHGTIVEHLELVPTDVPCY